MAIAYQPLESKSGFKSPGFFVDPQGNVTVTSITVQAEQGDDGPVESILTVDNIIIRGTQLVQGGEDSSFIAFGDGITGSNLQRLGILQYLDVIGETRLVNGSSSLNIENDSIDIVSETVGTLENFNIGSTTPGPATFTTTTTSTLNAVTAAVTSLAASGNITTTQSPTSSNHLTRKDYVDSRIAAFAIAFGA